MPEPFGNPAVRLGGAMGGGVLTATFVSAEIGAVNSATVVVTYSGGAPSVSSGHSVKVNSVAVTIASAAISGSTVRLTLADAPDGIDTILVSNSGSGNIVAHTDSPVTNNAVSMSSFGTLRVAFTPHRRPDKLYKDALAAYAVEDGDWIYTAVSPWGSGNNLVQTLEANRPTYTASTKAGTFVLVASEFMDATVVSAGGRYTLAVVFDVITTAEQDLAGDDFNNGGMILTYHQTGNDGIGIYLPSISFLNYSQANMNTGTWLVVVNCTLSGATQTVTMWMAKVGTDSTLGAYKITSSGAKTGTGGGTLFRIGRRTNNTTPYGGDIMEVLWYPGGVSDITAFNAHMDLRWL